MSETKWTPGPWEYRAQGNCIGQVNGSFIVGCNDTRIANISLLAAAPDLYEALERFVNEFAPESMEIWKQGRAALAKARGE